MPAAVPAMWITRAAIPSVSTDWNLVSHLTRVSWIFSSRSSSALTQASESTVPDPYLCDPGGFQAVHDPAEQRSQALVRALVRQHT
jgi:hypothetical protein